MFAVALLLLGLSAFIVIGNWYGLLSARAREKNTTVIPVISVVLSFAAWLLAPEQVGELAFLPCALDPATWMVVGLPVILLRQRGS